MNKAVVYNKNFANNKPCVLNAIRRIMTNEIPTWTFDKISFKDFDSVVYNAEYIVQRMRLIPLFQERIPKEANDYVFSCNVVNNSSQWRKVTPKDITNPSIDLKNLIKKDIYENLPIIILPPNDSIKFTCQLVQNVGNGYNKYCHSWYDEKYFYVEPIDKVYDTDKAINTAIDMLIHECDVVKNKLFDADAKKFEVKTNIELPLNDVSRSALNLLVDYMYEFVSQIVEALKQDTIAPNDFIISVNQPHMSEQKYVIFITLNEKYVNIPILFHKSMQKHNISYNNIKNESIKMLVEMIDFIVNNLKKVQTSISNYRVKM